MVYALRHLDTFRIKAEAQGKALPITISIGVDPAIYIGACFEPPTMPLGFDELSIAGALSPASSVWFLRRGVVYKRGIR